MTAVSKIPGGKMNQTVDHIIIENSVRNTPTARRFVSRYPEAAVTVCPSEKDRPAWATEVKSPKRAVYIARRRGPFLKEFPGHPWYGPGGGCRHNLILGYNCLASCRYCFVQTIFDDPIPTIFADSGEMISELRAFLGRNPDAGVSTGEYIDSLLFDDVTGYTRDLMNIFAGFPSSTLELRTKSPHVEHLPAQPIPQVLVSYSISPPEVVRVAEPGTADLATRLENARRLHDRGYKIGLRVDPIVPAGEFLRDYRKLPTVVERHLGWRRVDRVFLGMLRFDTTLLERMSKTAGGRRLLDAEYIPCPDGYYRPFRHVRIDAYRMLVGGIRDCAPGIDISITMEPGYVHRAVLAS